MRGRDIMGAMQHFDLVIIGSGSGNGIITDDFANQQVAIIERHPIYGGTCLNRGCIPTKMYVLPADHAVLAGESTKLGVDLEFRGARWNQIRDRIFGRINPISQAGKAGREASPNITVFTADASFVDAHTLDVGDTQITADQIVIATGSRPRPLEIEVPEDLAERIHDSDSIMHVDELPERLVILGGGFVAMEFAHIFSSLGSEVTVINRSDMLLRGQDEEISAALTEQIGHRVKLRLNQSVSAIESGPANDLRIVSKDRNGIEYDYLADAVLVAIGRIRNSDTLNLEAAGVEFGAGGQIKVDATQRTTQPHIWALGDVSSDYLLKHVANKEARTVQHNLLHPDDLVETDHRFVPSAVFTHPQIASVGATEAQLMAWGTRYVVARQRYADVAYGWALEDESNFVKLLADPHHHKLLGAHIIGPQASTLIQPLIQAMSFGLSVEDMARGQYWIHPALPEVIENALLGLVTQMTIPELASPNADLGHLDYRS